MAVYEANIRSLAEFISDVKFGFLPEEVKSTIGCRVNQEGSSYEISANNIVCNRISVWNDCFVSIDGNLDIISYVPSFEYYLNTNELSSSYDRDKHLRFCFSSKSLVIRNNIGKDVELKSYDDFKKCLDKIMHYIESHLEASINDFIGNDWNIHGVTCDIVWHVDMSKSN